MVKALKEAPEVVVATPGRLMELLGSGATNMRRCTLAVIDGNIADGCPAATLCFLPPVLAVFDTPPAYPSPSCELTMINNGCVCCAVLCCVTAVLQRRTACLSLASNIKSSPSYSTSGEEQWLWQW